ncbi:MAG: GGDEF domain-containing protein [Solirubrobacteraceae bacterium]
MSAHDRVSWLCPTDADRRRALDMSPRVRRARDIGSAAIGVTLLFAAPFLGWHLLALFALSAANLQTLDRRLARAPRPELTIAGSLIWTTLVIAAAAATTGGPTSPLLPWIVIPGALAAARFRPRVLLAGGSLTVLIMIDATAGVAPTATLHHPWLLIASVALLVNVLATVSAVTAAEIAHRVTADTDALTGLLNRSALSTRFAELAHQALISDSSVVLIICDLDRFKDVNDSYGHQRGDRVLRDCADAMRSALRSFELVYRYGGEEFVIVLPGADLAEGREVAERVRASVAASRPGGLDLTLSAGIGIASGPAVELTSLFRAADTALYDAKHAGRDRVAISEPQPTTRLSGAARG